MSVVALLPAASYVDMPWRNGGGRTAEIARAPAPGPAMGDPAAGDPAAGDPATGRAAGGGEFAWRLSIATIERDGPFSAFPGCDRTLVVLTGAGVALEFADGATLVARAPHGIVRFAGESAAEGRLLGGPSRDLNAMTRRDLAAHRVSVAALDPAGERFASAADVTFLVCLAGRVAAAGADGRWTLDPPDSLKIEGKGAILTLAPAPAATLALVEIDLVERALP